MSLVEVVSFIQGVGFPIFVAVYLLIFFNTTIRNNTQALNDLMRFLEGKNSTNGGQ
jgi:hypothetical protein